MCKTATSGSANQTAEGEVDRTYNEEELVYYKGERLELEPHRQRRRLRRSRRRKPKQWERPGQKSRKWRERESAGDASWKPSARKWSNRKLTDPTDCVQITLVSPKIYLAG